MHSMKYLVGGEKLPTASLPPVSSLAAGLLACWPFAGRLTSPCGLWSGWWPGCGQHGSGTAAFDAAWSTAP